MTRQHGRWGRRSCAGGGGMAEVVEEARPQAPAVGWRGRLGRRRGYLWVSVAVVSLAVVVTTVTVWTRAHPVPPAATAHSRTLALPVPTTPAAAEPPLAPAGPETAVPAAEAGSTTASPPPASQPGAPGPPPLPPAATPVLTVHFTPSTRW